ncbi:MAG: protein translocase subunit SecD [bacterium]
MNFGIRTRILIVLAALAASIFVLLPTWRYYRLSADQKAQLDPSAVEHLKSQALRLGLDLQGGMHMVLELDDSKVEGDYDKNDMMQRALEIIRNRIDQFGVTEPVVQAAGEKRIIVELAGIDDLERAQQIISQAAVLEFKMVRPGAELRRLLDQADQELARHVGLETADAGSDSAAVAPVEDPDLPAFVVDAVKSSSGHLLSSSVVVVPRQGTIAVNEIAYVAETDFNLVDTSLKYLADSTRVIPRDVQFAWGSDVLNDGAGNRIRYLYLLTARPELTGGDLESARPQPDNSSNIGGNFLVEFDLTRNGRRLFSRTTGDNVGKLMAIVLDGRVKSAPEIQQKIRAGTASITGRFTTQEATDLAIVLRAGALPVPIVIEEQRGVGPSLGHDSITLGRRAILFGFVAVLVFMAIYYRAAGLIAVVALLLNLLLMLAALVLLGAVLTLPGLAGFVLTVGMAVDANVLIYERIREELRSGQTFRNALSRGYDRAFRTILDANMTTLFTALALLWFGTGPIKGFAVTLSIGIVISMFTALFVTRLIFDLLTRSGGVRSLPV